MADFINVGFGNMVNGDKIISMVSTDAAPIKRMIQNARDEGKAVDATCGRRTRAVLVMESGHLIYLPSRQIHYLRDAIANAMMRMRKMKDKGTLVVISGFSGAGKGTVSKALVEKFG